MEDEMDEMETTRLKLEDVNKNLVCGLCDGYLIDATTIIECLHSFCRTCIVTYLKTSKSCPKCETLVHKTRPHLNIRSDKLLQDLVYKIVPGLYKDEMKRRREFYTLHYEDAPKRPSEERGDEMSDRFVFTQEELISLALHYCPNNNNERSFHRIFKTKEEFKTRLERRSKDSIHIRYFQCKAAVCIRHIKKLIRLKYDLPSNYQIDMFYNEDSLRDSYSLADVALSYSWRRKSPLKLYFSMYEMTMQKVAFGEEVPKMSHSTGLRWQERPPSPPPSPTSSSLISSNTDKIHCSTTTTTTSTISANSTTATTTSLSAPVVSSSPSVSSTPCQSSETLAIPTLSSSASSGPSSSSSSAVSSTVTSLVEKTQIPVSTHQVPHQPSNTPLPSSSLSSSSLPSTSCLPSSTSSLPSSTSSLLSTSTSSPSTSVGEQSKHSGGTLPPPPAKKLKLSASMNAAVKERAIKPKVKSILNPPQQVRIPSQQPMLLPAKDNNNKTPAVGIITAGGRPVQISHRTSSSNKKSLLGKRHHHSSSNTPVLIAPAPAKKANNVQNRTHSQQEPILRMAKIMKLSNAPTAGGINNNSVVGNQIGHIIQSQQMPSPSTLNNPQHNASVSFIPISLASVLPGPSSSSPATLAATRPGAPATCLHPAFMNGYFQSITNTSNNNANNSNTPNNNMAAASLAAPGTTIRITPTGIALPINSQTTVLSPMSPGFAPPNLIPTLSSPSAMVPPPSSTPSSVGNFQCIAKTMSTLSLTSPPGSRCNTSASIFHPTNQLFSATTPSVSAMPPLVPATAVCASPSLAHSSSSSSSSSSVTTTLSSNTSLSSTSLSTLSTTSSKPVSVSTTTSATSPTPASSASPTPAAVPSQQSQTQGTDSSNHQLISSSTSSSSLTSSSSSLSSSSSSSSSSFSSQVHPTIRTSSNSHSYSIPNSSSSSTNGQLVQVKMEYTDPSSRDDNNPYQKSPNPDSNRTNSVLPESKTPIKTCPSSPPPLVIACAKSTPSPSSAPNTSPSSGGSSRKSCKQKTIADIANTLHQRVSANLQQNQNGTSSSSSPHSQNQHKAGGLGGSQIHTQQNGSLSSIFTSHTQPNSLVPIPSIPTISSSNQKNSGSSNSNNVPPQQTGGKTNSFLDIKLSRSHSQQPLFNPASLLLSTSQIMSGNPAFNIKKETTDIGVTPPPPPPLAPPPPPSSRPNPPSNLFLGMSPAGLFPAMHIQPPPLLFDPRAATSLIRHHQQQQLQQQHQHHLLQQQQQQQLHPHSHPRRMVGVNGQQQQARGEEPLNLVTRDKDFAMTSTPTTSVVSRHDVQPVVK